MAFFSMLKFWKILIKLFFPSSKKKLITGACVVDPGYNGELYVNLHNIGLQTQYIHPGDKIAQAVLIPIVHCGIEEVFDPEITINKNSYFYTKKYKLPYVLGKIACSKDNYIYSKNKTITNKFSKKLSH